MSAVETIRGDGTLKGIADYVFVEMIGAGSYGRYFKAARPERLGIPADLVAVKVLDRRVTEAEFRRVADGLRQFASIGSRYLVEIYDVGYSEGVLYHAMAYHPDGSLARPAAPLSRAQIAQAVADAARGAHDLHEAGVVHRDIKPSNVLLQEGRGRLSDLDLTPLLAPGMSTTSMGSIGTIEFMDPSTLSGIKASRLTDIWSLGLNLHRALSGHSAYRDLPEDPMETLRHMLHERPVVSADIEDGYRAVIERCIADDRGRRFVTAAQVADAIERAMASTS